MNMNYPRAAPLDHSTPMVKQASDSARAKKDKRVNEHLKQLFKYKELENQQICKD